MMEMARGEALIIELLEELRACFIEKDTIKQDIISIDKPNLAHVCTNRISRVRLDSEEPVEDDEQHRIVEEAIVQEVLIKMVEKKLVCTETKRRSIAMDVDILTKQLHVMKKDNLVVWISLF